ncbi:MAG: 3-deoxy-D-manno-octulosonic acid transferase [Pseudomonadota bacterium]
MTALLRLYKAVSAVALPFAARRQLARIRGAGFSAYRAHERLGHATAERPLGKLIWLHGASVGEAKSTLQLIPRLISQGAQVVLTSGTATSAQAVADRLPEGVIHQFAPLDGAGPMRRFLDHWRPDLCVLIESELWPILLTQTAERGIPVALLNARLSDDSAKGWKRFPGTAQHVMRGIRYAHAQDVRTRNHLRDLGLDFTRHGLNLKSVQGPPLIKSETLQAARDAIGQRALWVAASTHPGEEEIVLAAHRMLRKSHPDLLLILVPRHPERADDIAKLIDLPFSTRSTGAPLNETSAVYLADTMGETDLWYALSPIVFLGGSLTPVGGHTPFEPAAAGCAILHGPLYANFAEVYRAFQTAGASLEIEDTNSLAKEVGRLLEHPSKAQSLAMAAEPLAQAGLDGLDRIASDLLGLIHD